MTCESENKKKKNWIDAETVFKELNAEYPYLVLRNFEGFFDSILLDSHADVDILCQKKDKKGVIKLLGAEPRLKKEDGIHYQICIGSEVIPLDIRWTGDGYYDMRWEEDMLSKRVLDDRGFYRMDEENYFWSLLYHALFQKGYLSEEYFTRLCNIKMLTSSKSEEDLKVLLNEYMADKKYYCTIGKDPYLEYHFPSCCKGRIRVHPQYYVRGLKAHCCEFLRNKLRMRQTNGSK